MENPNVRLNNKKNGEPLSYFFPKEGNNFLGGKTLSKLRLQRILTSSKKSLLLVFRRLFFRVEVKISLEPPSE